MCVESKAQGRDRDVIHNIHNIHNTHNMHNIHNM